MTAPTRDTSGDVSAHPKCGLSSNDEVMLQNERAKFLDELASTSEGRGVLRRCHVDTDMTASAIQSTLEDLAAEMESEDEMKSAAAVAAVWDIRQAADSAAPMEHYRPRTAAFRWARSLHDSMDQRLSRGERFDLPALKRVAKTWGWAGNGLSVAAAAAVLAGHLTAAGVLIAVRILVTAVCWIFVAYPGDDSPDKPVLDSDPRVCVLGHAADVTMMTAFAIFLMSSETAHWIAGGIVWGASLAMIMGTVFRIASRAPRLHIERMMRGGSICAAVFLNTWSWKLAALTIMVGPVLFALIEAREAWVAMSDGPARPRVRQDGNDSLNSDGEERTEPGRGIKLAIE